MKINDQVCTLEQAKKLKELGVSMLSYFAYQGSREYEVDLKSDDGKDYPAFTVAELGVMLPQGVSTVRNVTVIAKAQQYYPSDKWKIRGTSLGIVRKAFKETNNCYDTEAQARSGTLIFLLENKLITPEEVNTRLTQ